MYISEYVFNIRKISKVPNKEIEYILELQNEEIFKINDKLYNIINLFSDSNYNIKEYKSNNDISLDYYNKALEYMIKNNIIIKDDNSSQNMRSKIRLNKLSLEIDLFKTNTNILKKVFSLLKLLINKYIFIITLINFLIIVYKFKSISFFTVFNIKESIIIFLLLILTLFIHEFGHLAACSKYNVDTGFLGFGLYTIIPRVYVDIKKIWFINNKKRSVIDISGIYFQMIYVNILFFIYYFSNLNLIIPVISMNLLMIIFNSIPLSNMDGYWFLLDYFNIYNIKLKNIKNIITKKNSKEKFTCILVYITTIMVNALFFIIIFFNTINYFKNAPKFAIGIVELLHTESSIYNLYYILKSGIGLIFRVAFIIFLLINLKKFIYSIIKKEKKINEG